MIVAVVDDLLFSSKIRSAAGHAGRPIVFVRSGVAGLDDIRTHRPGLIVIDLDRDPLDPIGVIRALKADADLRSTRVIGFVSHVHAARIAEARAAGIDAVLARSAFAASLPTIVAGVDAPAGGE
jgi:CheY-like chemotaxis protein